MSKRVIFWSVHPILVQEFKCIYKKRKMSCLNIEYNKPIFYDNFFGVQLYDMTGRVTTALDRGNKWDITKKSPRCEYIQWTANCAKSKSWTKWEKQLHVTTFEVNNLSSGPLSWEKHNLYLLSHMAKSLRYLTEV